MAKEVPSSPASPRLQGQCVALTGRLATLTREEARRIVHAQGGRTTSAVTRETTLLVVGQEAWPLRKDGRLNANLRRAQLLQQKGYELEVIGEQAFLDRLGLDHFASGICGRHTTSQLTRLLNVPRARILSWLRHRLDSAGRDLGGPAGLRLSPGHGHQGLVRIASIRSEHHPAAPQFEATERVAARCGGRLAATLGCRRSIAGA